MKYKDIYSVYQDSGDVPELLYYAFACDKTMKSPAKISTVKCAWKMVQYDLDNHPEVAGDCNKIDILGTFKAVLRYAYDREGFSDSDDFIASMERLFNACVYKGIHTMEDLIEYTECPLSAGDVRDKLIIFLPLGIRQHLSPMPANINDDMDDKTPKGFRRTSKTPAHLRR